MFKGSKQKKNTCMVRKARKKNNKNWNHCDGVATGSFAYTRAKMRGFSTSILADLMFFGVFDSFANVSMPFNNY